MRDVREHDCATLETLLPALLPGSWSAAALLGTPYSQRVLTSETGDIVAFVEFQVVLDECHLLAIAVAPDHQRRGYGGQLLQAMLDEVQAAGCVVCLLEVRRSNLAARALYERLGFTANGCRPGYYGADAKAGTGTEDALLYSLSLGSSVPR